MKVFNYFTNIKEKFMLLCGKNKKLFILVLILFVSICLSIALFPTGSSSKKSENKELSVQLEGLDYSSIIESKIETMLLNLSEIEKVDVMVVCDSTEYYEYLKNIDETKNDNNSVTRHEEVVFQKDGSNAQPIIVTSKMPKIVGVWIILNSVSASTKLVITNSIKSVLNIDESCISILQER